MQSPELIALATQALQAAEQRGESLADCRELRGMLRDLALAALEMIQEREDMAARLMRGGMARPVPAQPPQPQQQSA